VLGIDEHLAGLGGGSGSLLVALAVALLLGLRHATDPDHLTALSTLVLAEDERGVRQAGRLGLAWGAGHALTLVALGLPVLLLGRALPDRAQLGAELLIAVVIVALAVRLLLRWRRGYFHAHPHEHAGGIRHSHPHAHEHEAGHAHAAPHPHAHEHPHAEAVGRSPREAFGIGVMHGAGGSAGVGILLVAGMDGPLQAAAALLLFAAGTAVSMALVSAGWGRLLVSHAVERRLSLLAPAFGTLSLLFGCWYGATAALG
jgi:ABC-type nickel/cobalt efflux system permease component RcnA